MGALDDLPGRSPAPVPVPEGHECQVRGRSVTERDLTAVQLGGGEHRVVGVHGWEVREEPRPVESLPVERVMGEGVRVVPRQLLREHPSHPHVRRDSGQVRGVPEGVREPDLAGLGTEVFTEERLPLAELPDEGLPADHVGVRLHPLTSHDDPPPLGDALPDAREHVGMVLEQPLVLLGGGGREDKVRVLVHEFQDVGEGADHLPPGLADRPQPRRVDVGVPHRHDPPGRGIGGGRQGRDEGGPGGSHASPDVIGVEGVHRPLQRGKNSSAPR